MNTIDIALSRLASAILDSQEYREYDLQLKRVTEHPELKAQIDEFRKRNYELQTSADTAFEKIEEFEEKYSDFRQNPMVSDFLAAELAFCRMMQNINLHLTEALHFE